MNYANEFEQKYLNGITLELPHNSDSRILCPFALPFKSYCEALLADALQFPTDVSVNLAQLDLQTKFHAWYSHAPMACRRHFRPKKGFLCLFQTYQETWSQLFELQQRIVPPRLRELPPPPAAPQVRLAGITWGESLKTE